MADNTEFMPEEGDKCPLCSEGHLEYIIREDCYCHLSAPCHACVEAPLTCDNCGDIFDEV